MDFSNFLSLSLSPSVAYCAYSVMALIMRYMGVSERRSNWLLLLLAVFSPYRPEKSFVPQISSSSVPTAGEELALGGGVLYWRHCIAYSVKSGRSYCLKKSGGRRRTGRHKASRTPYRRWGVRIYLRLFSRCANLSSTLFHNTHTIPQIDWNFPISPRTKRRNIHFPKRSMSLKYYTRQSFVKTIDFRFFSSTLQ